MIYMWLFHVIAGNAAGSIVAEPEDKCSPVIGGRITVESPGRFLRGSKADLLTTVNKQTEQRQTEQSESRSKKENVLTCQLKYPQATWPIGLEARLTLGLL